MLKLNPFKKALPHSQKIRVVKLDNSGGSGISFRISLIHISALSRRCARFVVL